MKNDNLNYRLFNKVLPSKLEPYMICIYLDIIDRQANDIFENNGINITEIKSLNSDRYVIVICEFPQRLNDKFVKCMKILETKIMVKGYEDYKEFCHLVFDSGDEKIKLIGLE